MTNWQMEWIASSLSNISDIYNLSARSLWFQEIKDIKAQDQLLSI